MAHHMSTNQSVRILFQDYLQQLSQIHDKNEARAILFLLFESITGLKKTDILSGSQASLAAFTPQLDAGMKRLLNHEPVQQVTGQAWFMGDLLKVTPNTLIPRQETEELVALIVKENKIPNPKILDIGTGSGAIALALKKQIPKATVTAWDVSEAALRVAAENGAQLRRDICFEQKDIFTATSPFQYDIIVSNPPYIGLSEKSQMSAMVWAFEPEQALFVSDENPLIFYEEIAKKSLQWLKKGGKVYVEINERWGKETALVFESYGYQGVAIIKDLYDRDRMVNAVMIA
jgi:release factor glutamine methyltransferase